MTAQRQAAAPDLASVEELLYREADCLDAADLDAWIELYTEDASYWLPVSPEQTNPHTEISIFYDDRLMMEIRRRNFGDEFAPSMEYPVRCAHLIGNIRLAEEQPERGGWRVLSNFQDVIYYRGEQNLYAGRYTHEIVDTPGGLRIWHKRVDLLNCDSDRLGSIVIYI